MYFYAFLLGTDGYGLRVNISEMAKVDEPPSSFTQRGLDRSGGLCMAMDKKRGCWVQTLLSIQLCELSMGVEWTMTEVDDPRTLRSMQTAGIHES